MGIDGYGQLCYGILFEEEYLFPWYELDEDIDDWWVYVIHKRPRFKTVKNNDWNKEIEKKFTVFLNEEEKFLETHPIPVEIVLIGSDSWSRTIIALKNHEFSVCGDPLIIKSEDLTITVEKTKILTDFCKKYLSVELKPHWYLSSYMG